ncbi:hypothetical protein COHA_003893 [Chlorella ohadii]|uniref:Expansin-like EG45 domain-containing protein n=1 Tax=Chlorella ohadii TaxID=2649997 RepID=A0AAD5DQ97_9CHLO|nr:hypothetical protein COHA_003893 [Chlorella ohadii]
MAGRQHVRAAALLCLGLLGLAPLAMAYSGEATAYSGESRPGDKDATGRNACGFGDLGSKWETWYAAMNSAQFGGSCGRCIRARGTERPASGKWHVVKIVDMCPSCSHGDVDFSTTAFEAITGLEWDRKSIEWEWTDCNQEAADKKRKEEERKAAEKKAAEQKRKEEEKKKRQAAEQKRAAEEKARQEAEHAKAEEEAAQQAQQAQQEVQGQAAASATNQTVAGASAAAAATNATATPGNATAAGVAQQERPVSDWVVPCGRGRQRCPNLSLAARGYQCTTLDGTACCLTTNGKLCKQLANYDDETAAPAYWRGRNAAGSAAAPGDAESEAEALTETGGAAAAKAPAAAPAGPAATPSPAAAEPLAEQEDEPARSDSQPESKEAAASPAAAPASRRMLKY